MVGRNWQRAACGIDYLAWGEMGSLEGSGGAPELALHRAGGAIAERFAEVGSARGRPDFGVYFWRPAGAAGSAGVSVVQLAARGVCRGDDGVGDDGGNDGRRGNYAAGSDGDAAFLRLQHGGLFPALAGDGEEDSESAEDFSCELVPEGRGREIPVARVWGER